MGFATRKCEGNSPSLIPDRACWLLLLLSSFPCINPPNNIWSSGNPWEIGGRGIRMLFKEEYKWKQRTSEWENVGCLLFLFFFFFVKWWLEERKVFLYQPRKEETRSTSRRRRKKRRNQVKYEFCYFSNPEKQSNLQGSVKVCEGALEVIVLNTEESLFPRHAGGTDDSFRMLLSVWVSPAT